MRGVFFGGESLSLASGQGRLLNTSSALSGSIGEAQELLDMVVAVSFPHYSHQDSHGEQTPCTEGRCPDIYAASHIGWTDEEQHNRMLQFKDRSLQAAPMGQ